MLKMYGNIYGQTVEDFNAIKEALEAEGFQIAYQTEVAGAVVKEVESVENE